MIVTRKPDHASLVVLCLLLTILWPLYLNAETKNSRGLEWQGSKEKSVSPYITGKYHALIIGNNQYQDENGVWKNLSTPTNDAKKLAGILRAKYGFESVNLLLDVGRRDILLALNDLSDVVNPNDSVLVYYAGHGHLEEEKNRGYWVPSDAVGGDNTTYIRNSTIRDEINILASRSYHTVVISDSCFSGDLLRGGVRGRGIDESLTGYYKKVASKKSVQVLTAGGSEFVDDSYKQSGHSPFTYFLLNELKHNNRDLLSFGELASNVAIAVGNNVEQTPEYGVLLGAGDELGQFIFARVDVNKNQKELENQPSDNITDRVGVIEGVKRQEIEPSHSTLNDIVVPTLRL